MDAFLLIVPLFVVMTAGHLLHRYGVFEDRHVAGMNVVLTRVLLPVLLFNSTRRTQLEELGVAAVTYAGALVVVTVIALLMSFSLKGGPRGAFVQSSFRGNLAYLGLPVISAVVGSEAVPVAAAILAIGLILHIVVSIPLLQIFDPRRTHLDVRGNIVSIVTNPLILAASAGLLVAAVHLELPHILSEPLDLLGRAALPLALLVIGSQLSVGTIRERFGLSLLAAFLKLVFMPAVAYLLATQLFHASPRTVAVVVILAASPTAILAQTFALAFNSDSRLAASTVAVSTLLAIISFPLWSLLVGIV